VRGGGGSGSDDCTDSVAAKVQAAVLAMLGWLIVAGSGITKIAGVAKVMLLSWQQAIEQLLMPLPPWCSQPMGVCPAPAPCGLPALGFACLCAMHMHTLPQQLFPSVCQAAAHSGAHSSTAAIRHTHAPIFPGAIGMACDLFIFGVGRIPQSDIFAKQNAILSTTRLVLQVLRSTGFS